MEAFQKPWKFFRIFQSRRKCASEPRISKVWALVSEIRNRESWQSHRKTGIENRKLINLAVVPEIVDRTRRRNNLRLKLLVMKGTRGFSSQCSKCSTLSLRLVHTYTLELTIAATCLPSARPGAYGTALGRVQTHYTRARSTDHLIIQNEGFREVKSCDVFAPISLFSTRASD